MRVIEPGQFAVKKQTKKAGRGRRFIRIFVALAALFGGAYLLNGSTHQDDGQPAVVATEFQEVVSEVDYQEPEDQAGSLIEFSDEGFSALYENTIMPHLKPIENPPSITGNVLADSRIIKIGEDRGYSLKQTPTAELVAVDGHLLQAEVVQSWLDLKEEAQKVGVIMYMVSGYRSVEEQKQLFLEEMNLKGVSVTEVAEGTADDGVARVLQKAALPGYSKHHTGYVFDLFCPGFEFEKFKDSTCFEWLSADNYRVAKKHGFIPSYPPKTVDKGPNPEAWEYAYVGPDVLTR